MSQILWPSHLSVQNFYTKKHLTSFPFCYLCEQLGEVAVARGNLKKEKHILLNLYGEPTHFCGEEDSVTFAHSLLKCGGSLLFGKDSSDQKCFPLPDLTFWLLLCFLSSRQTKVQVDFSLNLLGLLGPATAMTALLCRLLFRGKQSVTWHEMLWIIIKHVPPSQVL